MVLERLDTTRNAVHNDYHIETLYKILLLLHSYISLAFSILKMIRNVLCIPPTQTFFCNIT